MPEEDEPFGLQDSQGLTNRYEAGTATISNLLGENLGVPSVPTCDDAVTKMFDDMGDRTVV
jgi:hypothetical protein